MGVCFPAADHFRLQSSQNTDHTLHASPHSHTPGAPLAKDGLLNLYGQQPASCLPGPRGTGLGHASTLGLLLAPLQPLLHGVTLQLVPNPFKLHSPWFTWSQDPSTVSHSCEVKANLPLFQHPLTHARSTVGQSYTFPPRIPSLELPLSCTPLISSITSGKRLKWRRPVTKLTSQEIPIEYLIETFFYKMQKFYILIKNLATKF